MQGAAANVPPLLITQLDQNVNEGQLLDLSGLGGAPPLALYIDTDLGDTHTATVNWGDGSPTENATVFAGVGSGALGGTHVYADQGTYTVTIEVMDNNGGMDSDSFDVFVDPVDPTATLGNSGPVFEGSSATVTFTNQFDPSSADTTAGFHYAYDINNDGTFDVGDGTYGGSGTNTSQSISGSLLFEGPSDYTVKARIIDKDGQFTDYTTTIHVNNAAPTLTNITGDTINENQVATISAKIVDPSTNDVFTVHVDWLDGSTATIGSLGSANASGTVGDTTYQWMAANRKLQLSHQYLDDGPTNAPTDTYDVSLVVSDDEMDSTGPYVAPVTVKNVPPALVVATMQNVLEGNLLDLSGLGSAPPIGLFVDPGTLDTHTATIDWGDGRAIDNATVFAGMGAGALGGMHVYADDGLYKVTVTVTDKDGESDTDSFFVTVGTQNPVVLTPHGNQNILEGDTVSFANLATFTDAGFDNPLNTNPFLPPAVGDPLAESFTYDIDWGDGRDAITGMSIADLNGGPGTPSSGTIAGSHTYADDGKYQVTVTVHDDNGGVGTSSFFVTVGTQNPVVLTPHGNQNILEGDTVSFANLATFTDAGFDNPLNTNPFLPPAVGDPLAESFTYDIDWGDGRDAITGMSIADLNGGPGTPSSGTIAGSHTYADDGKYQVTVTVHDDNGGVGTSSFFVTVGTQNPVVLTPHGNQNILEGDTVSFANLATFTDAGFDNPLNTNPFLPPAVGDPLAESFTYDIDWGDGRDAITGMSIADLNGGPGTPSSGTIAGSHTYADDGKYQVTVTVHDDNGGVGTSSFFVTVGTQNPVVLTPHGNQNILEGDTVSFANLATFTDAGFDNPLNTNPFLPPAVGDPLAESFTYDIDWGDGRDAITGMSIADLNGGPGTPSSGTIAGSHTYADDGKYQVTVTVHDDNGGVGTSSFFVTVGTQNPVVLTPHGNQNILEGDTVSFANLATFTDAGFDNPLNTNPFLPPAVGDPLAESFTYDIDWGDGRDAITGMSIADLNGGPGTPSSGTIAGSHTYADDGKYQVTVTVHDDNGGVGTSSFFVTVGTQNPVVLTPHGNQNILEGDTVSFANLATFTDAGFDNPLNTNPFLPPAVGDPLAESFTYDIDWGDGRDAITGMSIADLNGGPGTPSSGTIAGSHTYADDGKYQVTVTVHDDNGGVGTSSFFVTVGTQNPVVLTPHGNQNILEGDTVSFANLATFTDAGFDNPLNTNPFLPPAVGDPLAESFTYDIDWGDGRDAITGMSIADLNGGPGTPSSGTIAGSHTYADDGKYQVTVTVHDDNGGVGTSSFFVTVGNVAPSLTDTSPANTVAEGTAFVLSNLGGPLPNMGVGLADPGFDNLANPNPAMPPGITDPLHETFTGYTIDWGDGTADTPVSIVMRTSGSPGVPTTALFDHAPHTYADNGVYTVRIRVADDNMSGNFTSGTNGVDYIDLQFTITVTNVAPTLAMPAPSAANINENGSVNFTVSFSDPGFDNPANDNTPPNGGEVAETFTYDIDWGDGRHTVANVIVNATPGGVGVPSEGSFGESHIYADDGNYTVTVKIHDDDDGVDSRTFIVSVHNTNPVVVTPLNGDDVNTQGITRIRFAFSDLGFDNPANPTPPPNGDQFQESFTYVVNWGDGTIDTIMVTQVAPGSPFVVNSQSMVLSSARTSGGEGVMTTGSFEVEHRYLGPPDPLHPTADIPITVTLIDDNGGSVSGSIAIGNPGIDVVNVAIDTTPDVPRLEYVAPDMVQVLLDQNTTTPQSLQTPNIRVARSELAPTSDRYLELDVISPEGKVVAKYRLDDEALTDLRGLIATLPDNHYKIYLIRTDNNSPRLVLDVYVRRRRVVDPSDDSEGTRDRPPIEGGEQNQVQPLENNPQLQRVPGLNQPAAMNESIVPLEQVSTDAIQPAAFERQSAVAAEGPSSSRLRWAAPLAGLGLVAQRGSWSREVNAAFDRADERAWKRLRRAGRRRVVQ